MPRATALSKYQRLESQGIWREAPDAQRRDVIVSFGEASLVLSDSRSENALTHWSLPALIRLNPDVTPALYTPSPEGSETLELDDNEMIGAIETVRGVIESHRPRPGRLRQVLVGGFLLAVVLGAVFWLPGALIRHTAQVVPPSQRLQIGHMILDDVTRLTGPVCAGYPGTRALDRLTARLFPEGGAQIVVLPGGPARAAHLPGGIVLLRRDLIEDYEGPDVAAGYVLAERARAAARDPLVAVLKWAGIGVTLKLLTTGEMSPGSLRGYGATLLHEAESPPAAPIPLLISRFKAESLPTAPYAHAIAAVTPPVPGAAAEAASLLASNPFPDGTPPQPLIPDDSWVGLQGICDK